MTKKPNNVLMQPIRVTVSKKPGAQKRMQEEFFTQYMERLRALHASEGRVTPEQVKLLFDMKAPGFKVVYQKEGGAPARWGVLRLFFLWFDVQLVTKQKNCSERAACDVVFRTSSGYQDCERPTTLLRRLNEAKTSPMVETAQNAIDRLGWADWFEASKHFLDVKVRSDLLKHDVRL
jgi:hypothetical protein